MPKLLLILLAAFSLFGEPLAPFRTFTAPGNATDIRLAAQTLYAATDDGRVARFDLETGEQIDLFRLEGVKDFYGGLVRPRIYSIDVGSRGQLLILAAGDGLGGNRLLVREEETLREKIDGSRRLFIKEARFLDDRRVLLATMGAEVGVYDLETEAFVWKRTFGTSTFSDLALDDPRTTGAMAGESGEIRLFSTVDGKETGRLSGANLDNVYKVALEKGRAATAGQDRKVGLYTLADGAFETVETPFLVYSCALSPSGERAAFPADEENLLRVVTFSRQKTVADLKGHQATVNTILFADENRLFSAGDEKTIYEWRIP